MEKLLKLLNEYDPYIAKDGEHQDNIWGYALKGYSAIFPKELAESYIISSRYGFIKRLIDNDKINRAFCKNKNVKYPFYLEEKEENAGLICGYEQSQAIVMLLAISEKPIEDLISYLN